MIPYFSKISNHGGLIGFILGMGFSGCVGAVGGVLLNTKIEKLNDNTILGALFGNTLVYFCNMDFNGRFY